MRPIGDRMKAIVALGFVAFLVTSGTALADSGGIARGNVRLDGPAPTRSPLPVFKSHEVCGDSVPDERLLVGPNGGIRYAVVTVEGVRNGRKPERDLTVQLDNRQCRFQPHVQVAEVGQWLEIRNSDPVLHNADARMGSDTLFNVGLWPDRHVRKPLARAGLVAFTCDVRHTWMSAYIWVADHPYHTVTDAYGEYEIRDIPPGHYTLRIWHELLGEIERPLEISGTGTTIIDVAYPAPPTAASGGSVEAGRQEGR